MFAIDFTKPYLYKDVVYFHQGNLSTNNTLRCTLNTGGSNDLTGCNIICTFKLQNSTEISGAGRIIDPLNAIVDLVFPSNALAVGLNKLEILVNRSDGSVAQSPSITYDIWQGLTTGNGIAAETNYPILIELINSTNEASNKANSALNKANSMITDITDAIDNAYRSANEADIATSNANTKIEEVETAKTEMIKKVDTSIVTMKSDVETAKNEMASKADEKIADIDRALAAGTVDLEVKQARKDASGVVYDNLKQMLDANLGVEGKTLKDLVIDMNNMKEMQDLEYSTDKGYAVCEKTGNGTVKNLKIYGKSLINVVDASTWLNTETTITATDSTVGANSFPLSNQPRILYPNDEITIIPNLSVDNPSGCYWQINYRPTSGVEKQLVRVMFSENKSIVNLKLPSDFDCLNGTFVAVVAGGGSRKIKNNGYMIIKGNISYKPQYFKRIANVGNGNIIESSSLKWSGNLFDENQLKPYIKSENETECTIDFLTIWDRKVKLADLPFKENTSYKFICTQKCSDGVTKPRFYFHYTDGTEDNITIANIDWATVTAISRPNKTLEYISATYGNSGGTWTIKKNSICLYEDTSKTEYEPFEQDKKTPLYKDVDGAWKPILNVRGIDENNCDIVDTTSNKYIVNNVPIIFNGTHIINSLVEKTNTMEVSIDIADYKVKPNTGNGISWMCDKLPSMQGSDDVPHIRTDGSTPYGRIKMYLPKSYGVSKEQINASLAQSPITFIGTLVTPLEYEINPIYPEAFEDETLMLFKTGPISPRATWKITSNLPNFVKELSKQVRQLQDQVYKTNVANFTVALNTLDTKLRLDRLEAPQQ